MWQPSSDIVLISDPRVAAIPLWESGEALADARQRLRVDRRLADDTGAYAHLRAGLLARLERAERRLPDGYHLLVVEGYRPVATQRRYFEEYRDELQATFPDMSPDEAFIAASRYVSPVEVAPHTAGAAVDLTLCAPDGTEYDMGTEVNDNPEDSGNACYMAAPTVSAEARAHRKILAAALEPAGLVNYPTEWWHWSHGDRYWAYTKGVSAARYGPVDSPV
ncbi:M15 family metallopeptidase [Nonomuraea cavernae]|uniref:D-alanyl-D-alanine dipeptidase n=1 Tax=Nonomuraea cavernae TaxID=2045107 RepID=A0A917YTE5_9ACTN|nr:M15 family metallopeptidase [Nonomuraea cavernae]MCA2185294.1 M15 family metallopeptidase [Nonomuraea cavernae]GGO66024.1 D-alanyl-D-alanine dipeptidase [Nonomuraea cavernae]